MGDYSEELISPTGLQEFTDTAITDPVSLAAESQRCCRPVRRPRWLSWSLVAGVVAAAFMVGLLVGYLIL